MILHVFVFGRPDSRDFGTGKHDCWSRVIVDSDSFTAECVLDSAGSLLGGDGFEFRLANHVTRRVDVGVGRLGMLVDPELLHPVPSAQTRLDS